MAKQGKAAPKLPIRQLAILGKAALLLINHCVPASEYTKDMNNMEELRDPLTPRSKWKRGNVPTHGSGSL
jgi:hypothetical protein